MISKDFLYENTNDAQGEAERINKIYPSDFDNKTFIPKFHNIGAIFNNFK